MQGTNRSQAGRGTWTVRGLLAACLGLMLTLANPLRAGDNRRLPGLDFRATDLSGQTLAGHSLRGQVVLLDFWATWCGPCVRAIPILNRLRGRYRERGFEVLGMASYSGTSKDVERFLARHPHNYPIVVADEDLIESFQVIGYPTYFLIDRQGRVARQYVGEIESLRTKIEAEIERLLGRP